MPRGRSILAYLHLLVATIVMPFVGLLAYAYYHELQGETAEAKATLHSHAEMAAARATEFVSQSRHYLEVLARRPIRNLPESDRCSQNEFGDFRALHPEFASFMLLDEHGGVVCSTADALKANISMANLDWFQAIRGGAVFVIGRPVFSRFSNRWIAVLAHAIRDDQGQFKGAVALAVDLVRYRPLPTRDGLLPGIAVSLITADGTIVARSDAAETWVGKSIRNNDMVSHALAGETVDEEYIDVDGVRRLCGFSRVSDSDWVVAAGIPTAIALAEVRQHTVRGAVVLLLAAAIAITFALVIGRIVAAPLTKVTNAARALADGKLETLLLPGGPREMVELGEQLNRLLDVRARTETALRESQKRLQALFDNMREGMLLVNNNAAHVDANPALCQLLGYTRDEMLRLSLWNDVPPELLPQLRKMWESFLATGWQEGEFTCLRKDGTHVEVEYLAVANFMPELHLCSVRDITARREAEAKLARYTEHLKRLSHRLVEVQEDERRHLSWELHDRTGQNLTAISLHLSVIRDQIPPAATATRARVDDAIGLVGATLEAVRDVMADLRPPVLEDYGLLAALRWYGDIFARRSGLAVTISGTEASPRLPRAAETAMFRVAQEALNNVAKHAIARRIEVSLEHGDQFERLIVEDDGVGFDPANERQAGASWGIISMEERMEAVGGSVQVQSAPGQGTRVAIEVPNDGE